MGILFWPKLLPDRDEYSVFRGQPYIFNVEAILTKKNEKWPFWGELGYFTQIGVPQLGKFFHQKLRLIKMNILIYGYDHLTSSI